MIWTILSDKAEYESALIRVEELSENPPSLESEKGKELMLLGYLIDRYEEDNFPFQDQIESNMTKSKK